MRMDSSLPIFAALSALFLFPPPLAAGAPYPDYQRAPAQAMAAAPPDYSRYAEVESACNHVLSSASDLKIESRQAQSILQQLSFYKADWRQSPGDAPLMPLYDLDAGAGASDPVRLATFELTDIDVGRQTSPRAINVSATLGIGISRNGTAPADGQRYLAPVCQLFPGGSELGILFHGVYTESPARGGEAVLCLLGDAMLPSRGSNASDPWKTTKDDPFLQDTKIMLVIRYPKTFSLTSRVVHGEMLSMDQISTPRFFDKVYLSSQLGAYSNYQYGSEALVSRACSPYPYRGDELVLNGRFDVYRGTSFCEIIDRFVSREMMSVVLPNLSSCNSTDENCRKQLGPFQPPATINGADGVFDKMGLLMQDVRCEPRAGGEGGVSSARVSSVFRVVPPFENDYIAAERSGLDETTLPADGIWNSSSGQLCMVGCLGIADSGCDSRICLYFPVTFSITQRSVVSGRITSIADSGDTFFFPLSFRRDAHPYELSNKFSNEFMSYRYTKIKQAGAFLERSEPFNFGTVIKKSLLSYPKRNDGNGDEAGLSALADDLTFHVLAAPDPIPQVHTPRIFVQLEVLSLGSVIRRQWSFVSNDTSADIGKVSEATKQDASVAAEKQLLLNVSAELTVSGTGTYSNVSLLFLEGLYNPVDGRMYLIGCRDVPALWKVSFDSLELEDGLDCLIEVIVEYPPTTAQWLMNPTAKISISSRRNDDDPLLFSPIKLQTLPILYREQRKDLLSQMNVEGFLRILTLSVAIACVSSQLLYIRSNAASAPYVSLVMLGVQALGYSIPLITGAEALFAKLTSESYDNPSYDLEKNLKFRMIDYFVKVLVLGAFLLTLRLGQKVWKSRIRLLTRAPLEPGRVPNDRKVLMVCFSLHLVGFLLVLTLHSINAAKRPIQPEKYVDTNGNSHELNEWVVELEEYVGLTQDFFLLPQIIGNFLWQLNCKPLKKMYYIGITVVRILPHIYDYMRAPVFNPYFSDQYEFVNPSLDFYSKFGDIAIPVTAVVLAAVVYVQQKWGYERIGQTIKTGQKKLLPLGSRVYERLPSMSKFEAELVSGVNQAATA